MDRQTKIEQELSELEQNKTQMNFEKEIKVRQRKDVTQFWQQQV